MSQTRACLSRTPRPSRPRLGWWAAIPLVAAFGAGTADAQFFGNTVPGPPGLYDRPGPVFRGYQRPIPPDEVVERLEDSGFEDMSRPRFDGSNYLVDATTPRGQRVRLVVDAFRGTVVDRYALGRLGRDGRGESLGPRSGSAPPDEARGWFGNNLRPPDDDEPSERTARIDPRQPVEAAPLDALRPSGEPARPAAREPGLPRSAPERSATLPRAARPAEIAPSSRIDGGNPDAFKGEQRRPDTAIAPAAPARPTAAVPATPTVAPPAAVATVPVEPPKPGPSVETLSPVRPLKPQSAPDAGAPVQNGAREQSRSDRPVRIIGGVTPVPAAPSDGRSGSVTADSDTVRP